MPCKFRQRLGLRTSSTSLPKWETKTDPASSILDSTMISSRSRESSVSFGSVEIREYDRILGAEHVDLSTPLALGWDYHQNDPIPVQRDDGEEDRRGSKSSCVTTKGRQPPTSQNKKKTSVRNFLLVLNNNNNSNNKKKNKQVQPSSHHQQRPEDCPLNARQRMSILKDFGYSRDEIINAECQRLRNNRRCCYSS